MARQLRRKMDWGWWASRISLSKPVLTVAPFFDEILNLGVSRTSSALGDHSHEWLISPSNDACVQARRSRKEG